MFTFTTFQKVASTLLLAILLTGIFSCNTNPDEPIAIDPEFTGYISAFTSGSISNSASIRVQLMNPVSESLRNGNAQLFSLNPKVSGTTKWLNERTIEFTPDERLPSGKTYDVSFDLVELTDVPDKLRTFIFRVRTRDQHIRMAVNGLRNYSADQMEFLHLSGQLILADGTDEQALENIFTATLGGKKLPVTWTHGTSRSHVFIVDSIRRVESKRQLVLSWDGADIGVDLKEEKVMKIPSVNDFLVMNVRVEQQLEQSITISFSDPLDPLQELDGLITLSNGVALRSVIDLNEIKLFPQRRISGTVQLNVATGIKNRLGFRSSETYTSTVSFENLKPAVRLLGKGVIIPQTDGILFPFEAVNLNRVRVKVIKIFEDNVAQFLQVNHVDGTNELRRVGRPVINKMIDLELDPTRDRGGWNAFSLDLSELINTEPGAIYRVELSFDKSHSNYPCNDDQELQELETKQPTDDIWERPDRYYYYGWRRYDSRYNWNERDDPCKLSYYLDRERQVARNVLASDLGIIAKAGDNGSMSVIVTDMLSTDPLASVQIKAYDYQHSLLANGTTDANGMVDLSLNRRPYLVVAQHNQKLGYLRVDEGSALNMSMFQVSGRAEKNGVKGMIYGERGVWRPGDSLFLSFMLFDKEEVLPLGHPVIFELTDPRGRKRERIVRTENVKGIYDFRTATMPDDPTGNWSAKVTVGGSTFSKRIKIETVKPNRLKLALDFPSDILHHDRSQQTALTVKWLHGAPGNGLKADVTMSLSAVNPDVKGFEGYQFIDITKRFDGTEEQVFEGSLDEDGKAVFNPDITMDRGAPGMLKAKFKCRGFEHGGDISTDQFSVMFSPYPSYVGFKIPKGKGWRGALNSLSEHRIPLAMVDADGKKLSGRVSVEAYRIGWRWWWEGSENENLARYVRNGSAQRLLNSTTTVSNGKGFFDLKLNNRYWGRILLVVKDLESGHTSSNIVYMDYPGWRESMADNGSMGATMLSFETDKEEYEVGEKASLNIPSSSGGRLLVTIENGSRIIDRFWVKTTNGQTNVDIPLTAEMTPNAYAHVTLIQPHSQSVNDLPVRLYGVQPLTVIDPNSKLSPQIAMKDELEPESKYTVKVSEATGQPMAYTLAVVDEGLLDLTHFSTPDPWKHFNQKVALGVKTWDMYDLVLGAQSGEMAGLLALGGDEYNKAKGDQRANRFKPVVSFVGPFYLEKGATAKHELNMPDYVGSVRVMVVAAGNAAFGNAEKTVPVKKPLMVLSTLPRVLGPGESVKLPVTVFAMDENIKDVEVKVTVNGVVQINGKNTKHIHFDRIGDQVVEFDLDIPETIGIATVDVEVRSGKEVAHHRTELDVRIGNPPVKDMVNGYLDPGQEVTLSYRPIGMKGTNSATLELSAIPPLNLDERLKYLVRYPHGCIEQTTSSVFPQLALDALMDLDETKQAEIQQNINAGISRLTLFQTPEGGFTYWPDGGSDASVWGTNYAGHFLLQAKKKGYHVPGSMLNEWIAFQRDAARNWVANGQGTQRHYYNSSNLIQAYRLYTLALAGSAEVGSMNRLREQKNIGLAAQWRLAAAYALIGRNNVAKEMVNNLETRIPEYRELSGSYGSNLRDEAMILETLNQLGKRSEAFEMVQAFSEDMGSMGWYSTQTTAYILIAVADFMGGGSQSNSLDLRYETSSGNKGKVVTTKPLAQLTLKELDSPTGSVTLVNKGETPVFARVLLQGIPAKDDRQNGENGMTMTVKYEDMNGREINPTNLLQGTDIMAKVTVSNPGRKGNYDEMALTQVFPSGWEIVNNRILGEESAFSGGSIPEFQDIRDDRVYTYFDLDRHQSKTYTVQLNAAYAGRFYLPTVFAEAMYDNSINARKAGRWVEVKSAVGEEQVAE